MRNVFSPFIGVPYAKEPLAHITLARSHGKDIPWQDVSVLKVPEELEFVVTGFELWESELRPDSPLYRPIERFDFPQDQRIL